MGIKHDYNWVLRIVKEYKRKLEEIDTEKWQATPPIQGWSYSEVYYHIFDASLLSLLQLNDSAEGKGKVEPTAFAVQFILFLGMLPPGKKFKAPKQLLERLKKVSKAEVLQMIGSFLNQLELAYPKIKSADLSIKAAHPKMGYLNAAHWLRFIGVHLNHHLKQLNRIDKSF
ncbi:MAG: DinB family protein [Pedobacter sp.]